MNKLDLHIERVRDQKELEKENKTVRKTERERAKVADCMGERERNLKEALDSGRYGFESFQGPFRAKYKFYSCERVALIRFSPVLNVFHCIEDGDTPS